MLGSLSCFGLMVYFGLISSIIIIYQSLLIVQKMLCASKLLCRCNFAASVQLLTQSRWGIWLPALRGLLQALARTSDTELGLVWWGSGTGLSSPASSSEGSGTMLHELLRISGGIKDPGAHLESLKELEDFGRETELSAALLPAGLSAKA